MHTTLSPASAADGGGRARRRQQDGPGQARGHKRGQRPVAEMAPADGQRRNRDLGLRRARGASSQQPTELGSSVSPGSPWGPVKPAHASESFPGPGSVHTRHGENSGGGVAVLQYFVSGTILTNFGAGVNLTGLIIYKRANYPVVVFYKGVNRVYLLCFKSCRHLSSEKLHFGNNTIFLCSFISFLLFITRLEILCQMSEMEN